MLQLPAPSSPVACQVRVPAFGAAERRRIAEGQYGSYARGIMPALPFSFCIGLKMHASEGILA